MTMKNPSPDDVPDVDNISSLLNTLKDMHDELARTSSMLKDYRYYLDSVRRSADAVITLNLVGNSPPR